MEFTSNNREEQLSLLSLVDTLDALGLILTCLDVLVATSADRHMRQKRFFYPFAVLLEGLRREIHTR